MSGLPQWIILIKAVAAMCSAAGVANAQVSSSGADEAAFRELYKELIEISTTRSVGDCTRAGEAMRKRLLAAGYPAEQWNAMLRTTCIVSEIEGGHAPNAIPQHVQATVNCRILPGTPVVEVQAESARVVADDEIRISTKGEGGVQSPIPPLTEAILGPARVIAAKNWPGVSLVPTMLPGYTDGNYLNPVGITSG